MLCIGSLTIHRHHKVKVSRLKYAYIFFLNRKGKNALTEKVFFRKDAQFTTNISINPDNEGKNG